MMEHNGMILRAQGCLLGQLSGDALGSLVEFRSPASIRDEYPEGVRDLADGGCWDTIAGQPTDDSEMALLLARLLVRTGSYHAESAQEAYIYWLNSGPFDCGMTISTSLRGIFNPDSQANGALMRISPLGIFGARHDMKQTAAWAMQDAELTHLHPVCLQANALFAMAIAGAVKQETEPDILYGEIRQWAEEMSADQSLADVIARAADEPPKDYLHKQGWVLIAFHNALYQLLHAENTEEGIIDTVMHGGDTDTNAAICGALLGAVHGKASIPPRWTEILLNCRPEQGRTGVIHPRPECFWPTDALEIARELVFPS